jgi:hypothetical protein
MYVETLLWLQYHPSPSGWDTVGNAVLESHLIHARILIKFLSESDSRDRKEDVLAEDYFHDIYPMFNFLDDAFLNRRVQDIGGQAVHITKKSMPNLRSQKDWPLHDIADRLKPAIKSFLDAVPKSRLADSVNQDCLGYLSKIVLPKIPVSLHPTT